MEVGRSFASRSLALGDFRGCGFSGFGAHGVQDNHEAAGPGFGGGVRYYYIGRNWGLRPEIRYQRYSDKTFGSVATCMVGFFYQGGR